MNLQCRFVKIGKRVPMVLEVTLSLGLTKAWRKAVDVAQPKKGVRYGVGRTNLIFKQGIKTGANDKVVCRLRPTQP